MSIEKKLNIITNLLSHNLEVNVNELTGVKDTSEKVLACAIAQDCSGCKDHEIARYFAINPHYMNKRIEDLQVQFLVGTDSSKKSISDLFTHARNILQIIELNY
jgi:hypothetical protein